MNPNSLKNLSPIKPGERRALKPKHKRKRLVIAGRVEPRNVQTALEIIAKTGSKSKAINHLLDNYDNRKHRS